MKYERLTERNGGDVIINCKQCEYHEKLMICTDYSCIDSLKNRLAELEDKIERGELVENKVVTYINMARSDSKTLIDKAIKYDKLKNKIENGTLVELPRMLTYVDYCYGIEKYVVEWIDNGRVKSRTYWSEKKAEQKLKELGE